MRQALRVRLSAEEGRIIHFSKEPILEINGELSIKKRNVCKVLIFFIIISRNARDAQKIGKNQKKIRKNKEKLPMHLDWKNISIYLISEYFRCNKKMWKNVENV
jgi:hypothetical protein